MSYGPASCSHTCASSPSSVRLAEFSTKFLLATMIMPFVQRVSMTFNRFMDRRKPGLDVRTEETIIYGASWPELRQSEGILHQYTSMHM